MDNQVACTGCGRDVPRSCIDSRGFCGECQAQGTVVNYGSSDDISNKMVELEKKLKSFLDNLQIVQDQYSDISREILVLKNQINSKEIERKDLAKIMNKSKMNIKQVELDLSILKKKYWTSKL